MINKWVTVTSIIRHDVTSSRMESVLLPFWPKAKEQVRSVDVPMNHGHPNAAVFTQSAMEKLTFLRDSNVACKEAYGQLSQPCQHDLREVSKC